MKTKIRLVELLAIIAMGLQISPVMAKGSSIEPIGDYTSVGGKLYKTTYANANPSVYNGLGLNVSYQLIPNVIAEKCANKSSPPSSGVTKPKPFASLNHFTVPVAMCLLPYKNTGKTPAKLFETKIAHGKTSIAKNFDSNNCVLCTLNQYSWQGNMSQIRRILTIYTNKFVSNGKHSLICQ